VASKPKPDAGQTGPALGLPQDTLSAKELQALYKVTARQLKVSPQLRNLFQKAWNEQWNQARWDSELEQLPWFRNHQASVRQYLLTRAEGGADWDAKKKDAFEFVRSTAMNVGVNLTNEQLWDLADQSLMLGWGEAGQDYELKRAIAEMPSKDGEFGGDIQKNADTLQAAALANGVKYDPSWFTAAGKSVAAGLSQPDYWLGQIKEQAKSKFPVFAEQIDQGMSVSDLLSPYKNLMQEEWEVAANNIPVDDPSLLQAVQFDDKGQQKMENLGEFQLRLRRDPRWRETSKAKNKFANAGSMIAEMFGVMG